MDVDSIVKIISESRGFTIEDVLGRGRSAKISITRFFIWVYLHRVSLLPISAIARKFNRTKSAVFRGIRVMEHHLRHYKRIQQDYNAIIKELEVAK